MEYNQYFNSNKVKVFNDPIHGHIELSMISCKIIDTPQYQRLRDISQLGNVYYVYSGASSKRFEHSIGVAYLGRVFVSQLQQRQPELNITFSDILCIEIAGLCHDLGHGIFSHLFDQKILPELVPNLDFKHEHASIGIFDLLIKDNDLFPEFCKHGLNQDDIHFIKELILGSPADIPDNNFIWKGRGDKTFLYDIVANKRNGIDVDKFDYFARDCHVLGLSKSFDAARLMRFARVHRVERKFLGLSNNKHSNGKLEICFHVKEAWNLFELFHTRYTLHKRAYQHRVVGAVDQMITEAIVLANPYIYLIGSNNQRVKLSDSYLDYEAYYKQGEYILKLIENSSDKDLEKAQDIIKRLRKRDLIPLAGEVLLARESFLKESNVTSKIIQKEIHRICCELFDKDKSLKIKEPSLEDIYVAIVNIGYGKTGFNPVTSYTTFYQPVKSEVKDEESTDDNVNMDDLFEISSLPQESISRLGPREFDEVYIRVYCRYKQQKTIISRSFEKVSNYSINISSFK